MRTANLFVRLMFTYLAKEFENCVFMARFYDAEAVFGFALPFCD